MWKSFCRLKAGGRRCILTARRHSLSVIIGFPYIPEHKLHVEKLSTSESTKDSPLKSLNCLCTKKVEDL